MSSMELMVANPQVYNIEPQTLLLDGNREYVLEIKDLPEEQKPREKLVLHGPEVLSIAELLAIVFTVGTKKEGVMQLSSRLLKEYGERALLEQKNAKAVATSLDIPMVKACQLIACFELGRRLYKTKAGHPEFLRTAKQVYEYVSDMRELPKEQLRGIYLNAHYRLIYEEVISIGSLDANIVHPREVFRPALERSASAVILVHNHPSGVAKASNADKQVTEQLIAAGKLLGIAVLDHIIVTKNTFSSVAVNYH